MLSAAADCTLRSWDLGSGTYISYIHIYIVGPRCWRRSLSVASQHGPLARACSTDLCIQARRCCGCRLRPPSPPPGSLCRRAPQASLPPTTSAWSRVARRSRAHPPNPSSNPHPEPISTTPHTHPTPHTPHPTPYKPAPHTPYPSPRAAQAAERAFVRARGSVLAVSLLGDAAVRHCYRGHMGGGGTAPATPAPHARLHP